MVKKYSKQDEKILREFLNNLYDHHQSLKGGSGFTDFLHGFLTPFKQFGSMIPIIGKIVSPIAESVDSLIPGKKYDTIQDIINNKPSSGSGMKRGRGRPRKIKIEDPLKYNEVFTDVNKELIEDEKQKRMLRRPRGRPRKQKV